MKLCSLFHGDLSAYYTSIQVVRIKEKSSKGKPNYLDLILARSWSKPVPVNDLMYNMGSTTALFLIFIVLFKICFEYIPVLPTISRLRGGRGSKCFVLPVFWQGKCNALIKIH